MTTGERVRERMGSLGLSQAELARRINVAQPTIFKLVHDQTYSSRFLHKVAHALGTTPAYLAGETDDPEANAPPPPELSYDEWAWVEYWRALDLESRDAMVRVVRLLIGDRALDQSARAA